MEEHIGFSLNDLKGSEKMVLQEIMTKRDFLMLLKIEYKLDVQKFHRELINKYFLGEEIVQAEFKGPVLFKIHFTNVF